MTDMDPTTGMPQIPTGYRWVVTRHYFDLPLSGNLHVQLEKRVSYAQRRLFRSPETRHLWTPIHSEICAADAREVYQAALKIVALLEQNQKAMTLTGHYPPNRLEVNE